MLLYKYCDPRGVDIIRNLRLKVTPPKYLNDPFEWAITGPGSHLRFLEVMSEDVGLICLSETRDNVLMWSHYASAHEGLVIGFDAELLSRSSVQALEKVTYSGSRIKWNIEWDISKKDEMTTSLLTTKRTDWSYECEWRAIVPLSDCMATRSLFGPIYYYVPIPRDCIRRIILGARSSNGLRRRAMWASMRSGIDPIVIEKLQLDDESYGFKSLEIINTEVFNERPGR